MDREFVKKELSEAATLLLDAMRAENRLANLDPQASFEEAQAVLADADAKRDVALGRFRTMCARVACGLKG